MKSNVFTTLTALLISVSVTSNDLAWSNENNPEDSDNRVVFPVRDIPFSITDLLDRAEEDRDYLFQIPGMSGPMQSWNEWKKGLDEKYGLRFLLEWAALYQRATGTFGTEDDAAGYDLELNGTWTFLGKDSPTYSMLGFGVFKKKPINTELTPLTLFTQYGSLYPGGTAYGDDDLVVGEFWYQQRIKYKYGFRVGYIFPLTAYDYFPFKNYRTDFVDQNNVANTAIPLPLQGLGGFLMYKPTENLFFRYGVHDANADPHEPASETLVGELFSIFEIGFDTNIVARQEGKPPAGHVHLSVWHQDERKELGISSGRGFTITASQQLEQFHPFIRYGYADVDANGPTFAKQMWSAGTAVDNIFGQSKDRIAVSYSWTKPIDDTKNNQSAIDAYYRIQLTPQIQIGPTLGIVFDPVDNPDEDTVYVGGLRTRLYF